jgi:hypothetical protein
VIPNRNFSANDKEVLELVLVKRKKRLVTRETVRIKMLEIATSLKILWQDFEASNVRAVSCINCKGLGQKCPTSFLEKLIAYLCLIINFLQKSNYLLGKTSNRNEIPVFCDTLTNIKIDVM